MTPDQIEQTARQIERAYPGYHVWASDEGWWYATRTSARARGESPTVHGADPGELTTELAAEESSVLDRSLSTATCSPTTPCRPCRLWFGACERPAFRRAWPPLFCWPADFEFSEELARVAAVIRESGTQRPARGRIACPGGWRMECHKFYHCADPHERLRDI